MRPRRARDARTDAITEGEWCFMFDAPRPASADAGEWWSLQADNPVFRPGRPTVRELWESFGGDVLRAWVVQRPGTRPTLWWHISAPEPQRRRVGGVGTPAHECLAMGLVLHLGTPTTWLTPELAAYYRSEGPFHWPAFDMDDPPMFESQAAYLDRRGLLTAAERKQLTRAAFEDEPPVFLG